MGISNLLENFTVAVSKYPNNKCLGWREKQTDGTVGPYVWKTYKEVGEEVILLASGLKSIGAQPKGRIGVFGPNSPQWMMAMQVKIVVSILNATVGINPCMQVTYVDPLWQFSQACNRMNAQCVPLYDSLGENAIEFIINHSESSIAFVATDKLVALAKALPKTKGTLKSIVYWGEGHPASIEVCTCFHQCSISVVVDKVSFLTFNPTCLISKSIDCQVPRLHGAVL